MKRSLFFSYINTGHLKIDDWAADRLLRLARHYLAHEFDLLGSGWTRIEYGMETDGFWGRKYHNKLGKISSYKQSSAMARVLPLFTLSKCRSLSMHIDMDYVPIDWHIDYKSGFRFWATHNNSSDKYLSVIGNKKGVDIKAPWELGRLYHLPQLAVCAVFYPEKRQEIILEFKNQVLDFMVANPYLKTIQWVSAMEVSIRAVNLLTAYDILSQIDDNNLLGDWFREELYSYMLCHGEMIENNLEYGDIPENHYLSNLAGLTFLGAYLAPSFQTDKWLVFAAQELAQQVLKQFHPEGSHFEGSTSYHCLSAEFVLYSTALLLGARKKGRQTAFENAKVFRSDGIKAEKHQKFFIHETALFSQEYYERLYGAACFIQSIMKPDYRIVQVGDNDSGRLLKLSPSGAIISLQEAKQYLNLHKIDTPQLFDEDMMDRRALISGISALFQIQEKAGWKLEKSVVESLSGGIKIPVTYRHPKCICHRKEEWEELSHHKQTVFRFKENEKSLISNLKYEYYQKFGIVIFHSDRLFLSIVIDTLENTRLYGHTHNDKLSIEMMVDREAVTLDTGSFIYSPDSQIRDWFRSTFAHNTIHITGKEQNVFAGLWQTKRTSTGGIISVTDGGIAAYAKYAGAKHIRVIKIEQNQVKVDDYCNLPFKVGFRNKFYSNGYGKIRRIGKNNGQ